MTTNQIAWQRMLEEVRSNKARELEETRHNRSWEEEVGRHNRAKEQFDLMDLGERSRHNRTAEAHSMEQIRLDRETRHREHRLALNEYLQRSRMHLDKMRQAQREHAGRMLVEKAARISIPRAELAERKRSNLAAERQRRIEHRETRLRNRAAAHFENQRVAQGWLSAFVNGISTATKVGSTIAGYLL